MSPAHVGAPRLGGDGRWVISRHRDVTGALRDPGLGAGPRALDRRGVVGPLAELRRRQLINLDGTDHQVRRRMLDRAFTPSSVRSMRPQVDRHSRALVEAFDRSAAFDLVDRFAFRLPVTVITDMLGLHHDADLIRVLSSALVRSFDPELDDHGLDRAQHAAAALGELLESAVADRRRSPSDDLLSDVVTSAGQDGLSDLDLIADAVLLVTAGFETTMSLIANAVLLLLTHPAQRDALLGDPSLVPGVVEETLRLEPPISSVVRVAIAPVVVGGVEIPAGDDVVIDLAAANRDPAMFDEPDRFAISRPQSRHVAFGGGPHFCLGAALARLEASSAIGALLPVLHELRLVDPDVEWKPHPTVHCPARLMIEFDGSTRAASGGDDQAWSVLRNRRRSPR